MSQESYTDHGVSPGDLREIKTSDLVDTLRWGEKVLRERLHTTEVELRQARLETITAKIKAGIRQRELEEARRLQDKLRVELEQYQSTIRQLDEKADELKGQIDNLHQREQQPWCVLEGRLESVEFKVGLLAHQLYGHALLPEHGSTDQETARQIAYDVRGI